MGPPTARGNGGHDARSRAALAGRTPSARAAPGRSGGWYVRPAVRARSTHAGSAVAVIALAALASCGGGDPQDANEPEGDFQVEVVNATFPEKQKLGKSSDLEITVRNAGDEAVPNLAVTVTGFSFRGGVRAWPTPTVRGSRSTGAPRRWAASRKRARPHPRAATPPT